MSDRIDDIMKNYNDGIKKIDDKYEVKKARVLKKKDKKEIEQKIEYEKEFIKKLEGESETENKDLIERSKERLANAIKEKQVIDEENKKIDERNEKAQLNREEKLKSMNERKNSIVTLDSGREVTQKEKDKIDKTSLKDKAIRELTQESKSISDQLLSKKAELESKREEWNNFKYEFEKDENGNSTGKAINEDVIKKIHEDFDNIQKEMTQLNEMQEKCQKYLYELKEKTVEQEKMEQAWKDFKKDQQENKQTVKKLKIEQEQQKEAPQTKESQSQADFREISSQNDVPEIDLSLEDQIQIILAVSQNKIKIAPKGENVVYKSRFYRVEAKNKKQLKKKYNVDKIFELNKKDKKNIDWALVSILEKIDKNLVKNYFSIIKGSSFNSIDENSLEELNKRVSIEYQFNEDEGILNNLKEKRIARKAKELGIASLTGINEKSLFNKIKDKFTSKNLLTEKEKPKALNSGRRISKSEQKREEQKRRALDEIAQDRKSNVNIRGRKLGDFDKYKVENLNGEIEKEAQSEINRQPQETIEEEQEIK